MSTLTCHNCQGSFFEKVMIPYNNDNNDILLLRTEIGQLREQLNYKNQQLEQQRKDMEQLNNKYVKALDQVANIQHEKDLAERELEDLTTKLFEEANIMVADEKKKVNQLQIELNDIKKQQQQQQQQQLINSNEVEEEIHPLSSNLFEWIYDHHQFTLFQQFLQAYLIKPQLNQHKQHLFLKQCIMDDIEPCLGHQLLSHYKKKIIDALMDQHYEIEQIQYDPTSSSSSLSSSTSSLNNNKSTMRWSKFLISSSSSSGVIGNNNNQMDCACCNERLLLNDMHPYYYRFKINGENDWLYLDASCYDRLLAVCQFFNYLRQLYSNGQLSSSSFDEDIYHSIYMDLFNFKLSMFYARLGVKKSPSSSSLLVHHHHDSDSDSTVSTNGPMTPKSCLSRRMSYQVSSDGK